MEKLRAKCRKPKTPCQTPTRQKIVVLPDAPSPELVIKNDGAEAIYKVKLDGCYLRGGDSPKRCDWVLYLQQYKKVFFIELKSTNAEDAIEQFKESIKLFGGGESVPCCILVSTSKLLPQVVKDAEDEGLKVKGFLVSKFPIPPNGEFSATTTIADLLNAQEFSG